MRMFSPGQKFLLFRLNLVWGALAVLVWGGVQFWRSQLGISFSLSVFLKGVFLLALAAAAYQQASKRRPAFLFLGFFPLLWLATSQFQWDICALSDDRFWFWLVLFLISELVIFYLSDGQWLLALLTPLWMALAHLFTFSFFLPFCFLAGRQGRFLKRLSWIRWGGLSAGLVMWAVLQGWTGLRFYWVELFDLIVSNLFISFFLLGWLGFVSFSPLKGGTRPGLFSFFLLPLGFLFFAGPDPSSFFRFETLKWVLVFFAGFGWEGFRRDIMDRSWHGRLVWLALGAAFFGGVLP